MVERLSSLLFWKGGGEDDRRVAAMLGWHQRGFDGVREGGACRCGGIGRWNGKEEWDDDIDGIIGGGFVAGAAAVLVRGRRRTARAAF